MSKVEHARKILSDVPVENAFYFHTDVNVYTGRYALHLAGFCDTVADIDVRTIEFHLRRSDFEKWIRFLGDNVLPMQIAKLRKSGLTGENLRAKLRDIVSRRLVKLHSIVQGQTTS